MSERTGLRAQWLTVPNAVTVLRFALIVPIGAAVAHGAQGAITALVLVVVFAATDWIDGFLARLLDQRSRVGEILDPIADRLGIAAIVAVLAWSQVVPWWVVAVIAGVDLLVAATTVLAEAGTQVRVTWLGKVRTAFIMTSLVTLIAAGHPPLASLKPFGETCLMIGTGLHVVAGTGYLRQILRPSPRTSRTPGLPL